MEQILSSFFEESYILFSLFYNFCALYSNLQYVTEIKFNFYQIYFFIWLLFFIRFNLLFKQTKYLFEDTLILNLFLNWKSFEFLRNKWIFSSILNIINYREKSYNKKNKTKIICKPSLNHSFLLIFLQISAQSS